eukprot:3572967-Prymnesium_polylepis.1
MPPRERHARRVVVRVRRAHVQRMQLHEELAGRRGDGRSGRVTPQRARDREVIREKQRAERQLARAHPVRGGA